MSTGQTLLGRVEAAIAMPYLSHAATLPSSDPAVVVRVITTQATPTNGPAIAHAWLEIPLPAAEPTPGGLGPVACLHFSGRLLPGPHPPTAPQPQAIHPWRDKVAEGHKPLMACLEASRAMHEGLPPIDAVAWDWIPAAPEPLLLEVNSGFSLLVPQLWEHLGGQAGGESLPTD